MDVGERLTRVGTGAHLWPVQAVVWQKPTQHGKAIFFQLKILKSKAVCCPVLANPLLEKQERLEAWRPCRGDSVPSPPSRACLPPQGQRRPWGPRCRILRVQATPSPCSMTHSCPLLSHCTRSMHTRNRPLLAAEGFLLDFLLYTSAQRDQRVTIL